MPQAAISSRSVGISGAALVAVPSSQQMESGLQNSSRPAWTRPHHESVSEYAISPYRAQEGVRMSEGMLIPGDLRRKETSLAATRPIRNLPLLPVQQHQRSSTMENWTPYQARHWDANFHGGVLEGRETLANGAPHRSRERIESAPEDLYQDSAPMKTTLEKKRSLSSLRMTAAAGSSAGLGWPDSDLMLGRQLPIALPALRSAQDKGLISAPARKDIDVAGPSTPPIPSTGADGNLPTYPPTPSRLPITAPCHYPMSRTNSSSGYLPSASPPHPISPVSTPPVSFRPLPTFTFDITPTPSTAQLMSHVDPETPRTGSRTLVSLDAKDTSPFSDSGHMAYSIPNTRTLDRQPSFGPSLPPSPSPMTPGTHPNDTTSTINYPVTASTPLRLDRESGACAAAEAESRSARKLRKKRPPSAVIRSTSYLGDKIELQDIGGASTKKARIPRQDSGFELVEDLRMETAKKGGVASAGPADRVFSDQGRGTADGRTMSGDAAHLRTASTSSTRGPEFTQTGSPPGSIPDDRFSGFRIVGGSDHDIGPTDGQRSGPITSLDPVSKETPSLFKRWTMRRSNSRKDSSSLKTPYASEALRRLNEARSQAVVTSVYDQPPPLLPSMSFDGASLPVNCSCYPRMDDAKTGPDQSVADISGMAHPTDATIQSVPIVRGQTPYRELIALGPLAARDGDGGAMVPSPELSPTATPPVLNESPEASEGSHSTMTAESRLSQHSTAIFSGWGHGSLSTSSGGFKVIPNPLTSDWLIVPPPHPVLRAQSNLMGVDTEAEDGLRIAHVADSGSSASDAEKLSLATHAGRDRRLKKFLVEIMNDDIYTEILDSLVARHSPDGRLRDPGSRPLANGPAIKAFHIVREFIQGESFYMKCLERAIMLVTISVAKRLATAAEEMPVAPQRASLFLPRSRTTIDFSMAGLGAQPPSPPDKRRTRKISKLTGSAPKRPHSTFEVSKAEQADISPTESFIDPDEGRSTATHEKSGNRDPPCRRERLNSAPEWQTAAREVDLDAILLDHLPKLLAQSSALLAMANMDASPSSLPSTFLAWQTDSKETYGRWAGVVAKVITSSGNSLVAGREAGSLVMRRTKSERDKKRKPSGGDAASWGKADAPAESAPSRQKDIDRLGLADIIIMPTQRIARYAMLLKELCRYSDDTLALAALDASINLVEICDQRQQDEGFRCSHIEQ